MNHIKTYMNSLGRATRTALLGLVVIFVSAGIAQAATTISTDIDTGGALTVAGAATLNGNMVFGNALSDTLTLGVATTTYSDTSTLSSGNMNGTTLTSVLFVPKASTATDGASYHKLVSVGDVTGNTAFGFGATTAPTVGFMASFGRTVAAASGTFTDTGLDARAINKLDNSNATYTLQGAYIKASNYAGANLANLKGLFVEAISSGTITGSSYGIDIGTSGSTITSLLHMSSGLATYGIDMNGATFGTSDIRLKNGNTISNSAAGLIKFTGSQVLDVNVTPQSIADSGTIAVGTQAVQRVSASTAASKTGVILAVGTADGQVITLLNVSSGAYTFTFAASGTSHVATGATLILQPGASMTLVWDATSSLWYPN